MFYFINTPENMEVFNCILNGVSGQIYDIKFGPDKIGFRVKGDVFKVLDEDLLQQFISLVEMDDKRRDDYVDDVGCLKDRIESFLSGYNMKLSELAELIDVSYSELKSFIYEKVNNLVQYKILTKLAMYFECTYSELCNVNYVLKRPS